MKEEKRDEVGMDLGGLVCEMKEGRKYRQRNKGKDGWMESNIDNGREDGWLGLWKNGLEG